MSVTTEKSLRVFNDKEGVSLVVRVSVDGPEFGIEVVTTDCHSKEWFGAVSLPLRSKEYAEAIANAILEMSEEMEQ